MVFGLWVQYNKLSGQKECKGLLTCIHRLFVNNDIGFISLKIMYIESRIVQLLNYFNVIITQKC